MRLAYLSFETENKRIYTIKKITIVDKIVTTIPSTKSCFVSQSRGVGPNNGLSVSFSFTTLALAHTHTLALTVTNEGEGGEMCKIAVYF